MTHEAANRKLREAAGTGDLSKADDAVREGANVDTEFPENEYSGGLTPLGLAAVRGDKDMGTFLLEKHARKDLRTRHVPHYSQGGTTPEDIARGRGYNDMADNIKNWSITDGNRVSKRVEQLKRDKVCSWSTFLAIGGVLIGVSYCLYHLSLLLKSETVQNKSNLTLRALLMLLAATALLIGLFIVIKQISTRVVSKVNNANRSLRMVGESAKKIADSTSDSLDKIPSRIQEESKGFMETLYNMHLAIPFFQAKAKAKGTVVNMPVKVDSPNVRVFS